MCPYLFSDSNDNTIIIFISSMKARSAWILSWVSPRDRCHVSLYLLSRPSLNRQVDSSALSVHVSFEEYFGMELPYRVGLLTDSFLFISLKTTSLKRKFLDASIDLRF